MVLLDAEVAPLQSSVREEGDAVGEGDGSSGVTFAAGVNDGFDGAVDLGEGDLEGDLNGVEAELAALPLLERLEHEGDRAHIRPVQLLEDLDGLLVVLGGGASDEGEAGKVDHGVDDGVARLVVEVLFDGTGEVEASGVDADDAGSAGFELRARVLVLRVK